VAAHSITSERGGSQLIADIDLIERTAASKIIRRKPLIGCVVEAWRVRRETCAGLCGQPAHIDLHTHIKCDAWPRHGS